MLGRDCLKALFKNKFPPRLTRLESGFSRKSQNGLKVSEQWVSTLFACYKLQQGLLNENSGSIFGVNFQMMEKN